MAALINVRTDSPNNTSDFSYSADAEAERLQGSGRNPAAPHPYGAERQKHAGYAIGYPEEVAVVIVHYHVATHLTPVEAVPEDFGGAHRLIGQDVPYKNIERVFAAEEKKRAQPSVAPVYPS